MAATAAEQDRPFGDVVDSVRQSLQTEQNRTQMERDALAAFATRVTKLQPTSQPCAPSSAHDERHFGGGTVAMQPHPISVSGVSDEFRAVRTAYEETVMSVPFYEAEYGDTYEESIRAEFGPEIATALTQSDSFTPGFKRVLLGRVEHARREREALIEVCNREFDSIDATAGVLKPIDEELHSVEAIPFHDQDFGQLEAYRARLLTIEDECGDAASDRQSTIHQH